MNTRIYSEGVFLKQLDHLKCRGKVYCPHCHSLDIDNIELSYSQYKVKSKVRGLKRCLSCSEIFKGEEALTKTESRNKKIDEVLG